LGVPPPPQVSGASQPPQSIVPPQLSAIVPQSLPAAQVARGQPHAFAVPVPPQVSGSVHHPHQSIVPQPSEISSQVLPTISQVVG
jgi:hypothetical protein